MLEVGCLNICLLSAPLLQGCVAGWAAAAGAHHPLCATVLHGGASGPVEPPGDSCSGALAAQGQPSHSLQQHVELTLMLPCFVVACSCVCAMQHCFLFFF
jgi:hypothetical protein